MTEDRLAALVRSSADELWAAFQRSSSTAHPSMKGTAREGALLHFLTRRLPATVRVTGSGEVIDSNGSSAGQSDVLLIDPVTPPFVDDAHQQVVPIECVHGIVEVKSRLTSAELVDACAKIARVKALAKVGVLPSWPTNPYAPPDPRPTAGWVFAYDAGVQLSTLLRRFASWCHTVDSGQWPHAVYVLNHGSLVWLDPEGRLSSTPQPEGRIMALASGNSRQRDVLLTMILHMHNLLSSVTPARIDIGAYLPSASLGWNAGIESPRTAG